MEKENIEDKEEKKKVEDTAEEKKAGEEEEQKTEDVKEIKAEEKPGKKKIEKKDKAIVRGKNLPISTKQSVAICNFIRKKKIEKAIEDLEKTASMKKAIPMKGEIPHRKGMMSGRYPQKACKEFIKLLKSLIANSQVNGVEEAYIHTAIANKASQPYRRFGSQRFKRTNVYLEAREVGNKKQEEKRIKTEEKKAEKKPGVILKKPADLKELNKNLGEKRDKLVEKIINPLLKISKEKK